MKEPKIRFKGFSGEWKECTLSNIITVNSGKDYKHLEKGTIPVYGTGGYMLSVNTSLSEHDAIGIGRKGTIDKPQYLKAPFWTVDTLFFLTTNNGDNLDFLFNLSQNIRWQKYDESTGVPSLSKNNIDKIKTCIPNKFEQQSVASFFTSLDAQISASTSRLASLKQMKAASLQAMFPQEGETIPKVRFKGFEGEWKKVKLGEFGSWSKGKLLSKDNISETGKFKCIHYGELFTMYDEIIYQVFSKTDLNNGYLSQIGDILFPDSDVTPTGLARCSSIMETGVMLGGGILILRPLPQYYSPFISLSVNNEKQQIISRITGTTVRHINATSLSEIEIVCTENIAEQQSIASFFTSLDRQIALHTQRLEKLKQIKAACLNKMFV